MLRFTPLASAKAAYFYYGKTDSGLDPKELRCEVGGKAAERLGLSPEPDFEQFKNLLNGLHPETGEQLTAKLIEGRIAGWDCTASVPKGVTLLIEQGDERVHDALWAAGREAMADIEAMTTTRVRKSGQHDDRVAGNLIYYGWEHAETRPVKADGMPDPDRHIHFVIPNVTYDAHEEQWKAVKFRPVMELRKYFDRRFDLSLSKKLTDLGYSIETKYKADNRGGKKYYTWDVAGLPESLLKKNSRRAAEVDELAEQLSVDHPMFKDKLGATTRQQKQKDITLDELREYWQSKITLDEGRAIESTICSAMNGNNPAPENTADKGMEYAIEHEFYHHSVVKWKDLAITAMERCMGGATPNEMEAVAKQQGVLMKNGEVTTQNVLDEESRIISFAREGKGTCRPLGSATNSTSQMATRSADASTNEKVVTLSPASPAHQAFNRLSEDQKAVVKHIQQSPDRVIMIEGDAGTGKTEAMQVTIPGITAPGVFLAPSASASRGTLRDKGFKNADTIAMFLTNEKFREQARGGYIYIDEAPLASIKEIDGVFAHAKDLNARVIVQGDRKQHKSVVRGDLFEILDKFAGLKVGRLTKNWRQEKDHYKAAVDCIAKGNMEGGFDTLNELGWVKQSNAALIADYMAAINEGKSVLVVSPTHAEGQIISDSIRRELKEQGLVSTDEQIVATLKPLSWTDAEKGDKNRYSGDEILQFHRNSGNFKAGQRVKYADLKPDQKLGKAANFSVYKPDQIAVAAGDHIRTTGGGKTTDGRRVDNGANYIVKGVTKDGNIALTNGYVLPRNFQHISHDYVSTSHAAQGKTVDRVLIAMGDLSRRAINAAQFYVSLSRGRENATIYSDMNPSDLREAIKKLDHRKSATELMGKAKPIPKPRLRKFLERVRDSYDQLRENAIATMRMLTQQPEREMSLGR